MCVCSLTRPCMHASLSACGCVNAYIQYVCAYAGMYIFLHIYIKIFHGFIWFILNRCIRYTFFFLFFSFESISACTIRYCYFTAWQTNGKRDNESTLSIAIAIPFEDEQPLAHHCIVQSVYQKYSISYRKYTLFQCFISHARMNLHEKLPRMSECYQNITTNLTFHAVKRRLCVMLRCIHPLLKLLLIIRMSVCTLRPGRVN